MEELLETAGKGLTHTAPRPPGGLCGEQGEGERNGQGEDGWACSGDGRRNEWEPKVDIQI